MNWIDEILSSEAFIRATIVFAAVSGLAYLMKRMANAPAPVSADGNVYTLMYGWVLRAIGYGGFAFAAVIATLPLFVGLPEPGDGWIVLGMVGGFAGLGFCLVNEARRRVLLSRESIEAFSPWGRSVRLPWPEVSSVAFSHTMQQFMIRSRSGQKVRVSASLVGMPTFVDHLRQCLPPAAYADALDKYAKYVSPLKR